MFKNLAGTMIQNKNILMLITVGIYVLALFAVLKGVLLPVALIFSLFLLFLIFEKTCPLKYIIILVLVFYLGVINTTFRIKEVDELLNLTPINSEITGTIVSIPQGRSEGKPKFFFNVDKISFDSVQKEFDNEKVLVTMNLYSGNSAEYDKLKLYNSYVLSGRLSAPFKAGNPSQFDYSNYLRNYNTYAVFYAKDFKIIDKNIPATQRFMQEINSYREKILAIHSKYLNSPNLEILGGIVFGDDAVSPPKNIKESFVNSGLLHILAASGMNVAFIYTFFFYLMSILRINYKAKVILGMITVVIYSLMTGLGASVIRATFMLLFVLAGKLIDRDAHSISLLSFVGLLMLIYNPLFINDVGFQLSFIVTFGLLIMTPPFAKFENKLTNTISSCISVPIIAQLWVIPIQIFYFNNISLYSIFANIMSIPILMILSFGGFISSLLASITPIADIICRIFDSILNPLTTVLINISDFWGKLPHSTLQTTHPSIFQIIIYYFILLCIVSFLYNDFRQKYFDKILKIFSILLIILAITLIPIKNSSLEIMAFDVGNADSFLIKTPENKYFMIDTGKSGYAGGKSQAEIIMLKYFKDRGIKNIDSIVVTHFDNDHCGGTVDLVKNLKVDKLYVNNLEHKSYNATEIYRIAKEKSTDVILSQNEQKIYSEPNLTLTNYTKVAGDTDNDNSTITLLKYNDFAMLFTGDAGINGIKSVLKSLPRNITVLKVPHHGAVGGLDAEIINYLNPKYALISVGENKFGHPASITLANLRNTNILRTDINNSILFKIKSDKIKVYTYDLKTRKYISEKQVYPK